MSAEYLAIPRPRCKRCLAQTKTAAKESSDSTPTCRPSADRTEKLTTSRSGPDRLSGLVQQRIAFEASLEAIHFPFDISFLESLFATHYRSRIPKRYRQGQPTMTTLHERNLFQCQQQSASERHHRVAR